MAANRDEPSAQPPNESFWLVQLPFPTFFLTQLNDSWLTEYVLTIAGQEFKWRQKKKTKKTKKENTALEHSSRPDNNSTSFG